MFTSAGPRRSWRPGRSSEPSRWLELSPSTFTWSTSPKSTIGPGSCASAMVARSRCPNPWRQPWPRCAGSLAGAACVTSLHASRCTQSSRRTRPRPGAGQWSRPSAGSASSWAGSRTRGRQRADGANRCAGSPKKSIRCGALGSCARLRSHRWTRSARRWRSSTKLYFVSCPRSIASSIAHLAHLTPERALRSRRRSCVLAAGSGAIGMATTR